MDPIIIAALLLLQTWAPDVYQTASRYEIQEVQYEAYSGMAICEQGIIKISLPQNLTAEKAAGTLAHEAKHLNDGCPTYNNSGRLLYREAAAYRYQLQALRQIGASTALQNESLAGYWKFWWREHGSVRSLGILP